MWSCRLLFQLRVFQQQQTALYGGAEVVLGQRAISSSPELPMMARRSKLTSAEMFKAVFGKKRGTADANAAAAADGLEDPLKQDFELSEDELEAAGVETKANTLVVPPAELEPEIPPEEQAMYDAENKRLTSFFHPETKQEEEEKRRLVLNYLANQPKGYEQIYKMLMGQDQQKPRLDPNDGFNAPAEQIYQRIEARLSSDPDAKELLASLTTGSPFGPDHSLPSFLETAPDLNSREGQEMADAMINPPKLSEIKELRPLLRKRFSAAEPLHLQVDTDQFGDPTWKLESTETPQGNKEDGEGEEDEEDVDSGALIGDIRQIDQMLRARQKARSDQMAAFARLGDLPQDHPVNREEAEVAIEDSLSILRENTEKTPLDKLKYLKLYPKKMRQWIEDLKTPPGQFNEESGHWEPLELSDLPEYLEFWRGNVSAAAAEREAARAKQGFSSKTGLLVVAPEDTQGHYRFGIQQDEIDAIRPHPKVLKVLSFTEASQSEINDFRKKQAIKKWAYKPNDSGSTTVQIAVLTEKINYLSDHLNRHPKDKHSAYGFQRIRNRRRALMRYLKKTNIIAYFKIIRELNIRDIS